MTHQQPTHRAQNAGVVDGYDRILLAECLAERGLLIHPDTIDGVSDGRNRVDFLGDTSVTVLPRWIERARLDRDNERMSDTAYIVHWTNPATGLELDFEFLTREEAEAKVESYERKYGHFAGYQRAKIEERNAA